MRDMESAYKRRMLRLEYTRAYFSAILKLSVKDIEKYDEFGNLKSEYELTPEEKEALVCYVNGSDKQLSGSRSR